MFACAFAAAAALAALVAAALEAAAALFAAAAAAAFALANMARSDVDVLGDFSRRVASGGCDGREGREGRTDVVGRRDRRRRETPGALRVRWKWSAPGRRDQISDLTVER